MLMHSTCFWFAASCRACAGRRKAPKLTVDAPSAGQAAQKRASGQDVLGRFAGVLAPHGRFLRSQCFQCPRGEPQRTRRTQRRNPQMTQMHADSSVEICEIRGWVSLCPCFIRVQSVAYLSTTSLGNPRSPIRQWLNRNSLLTSSDQISSCTAADRSTPGAATYCATSALSPSSARRESTLRYNSSASAAVSEIFNSRAARLSPRGAIQLVTVPPLDRNSACCTVA